jgi:hypothetical protein
MRRVILSWSSSISLCGMEEMRHGFGDRRPPGPGMDMRGRGFAGEPPPGPPGPPPPSEDASE